MENERLLARVRERQLLLEQLSGVQHAILVQSPLQAVLDMVTESAAGLLGDDVVGLRLLDPDDPGSVTLASSHGVTPQMARVVRRAPVQEGIGGQAIAERRFVVTDDYASADSAIPAFTDAGIVAAMAAPVHEGGEVVGSLVVASAQPGRRFTDQEQQVLKAFAAHASLALNDAQTRQVMNQALDDAVHQALHDPLTGLPNRALFLDRLTQSLAHAQREGGRVAVFFIDLDDFKLINDSSGHATGDELLKAIAERITGCFRTGDTVARFGGDEFAVVVGGVPEIADVEAAAGRLLAVLSAPLALGEELVSATASIGVVVSQGEQHAGELLLNADVAMYHAKALGKGRWSLFRPEMHTSLLERVEIEAALRHAVENDLLDLVYQPIIELRSGTTVGVEALLRWMHPTRGPVAPAEFISIAEETGLIIDIGQWVLDRACRDTRGWRTPGRTGKPLSLTVNVSARQTQDAALVRHLRRVLDRHAFHPSRLTLEITESVLIDSTEAAVQRLGALKDLGVRLALDDFGTGYSSLSYLQRFPIDVVKIDKSFVDGLVTDAGDAKLVEAIVNLSQALALQTVAEGVETDEQRARLVELGCILAQGFLFARPLAAPDLARYLAAEDARAAGGAVHAGRPR